MIKTTIGELVHYLGPDDRKTCVYVIRDGSMVFYVGMSQRGTVNRVLQHCGLGLGPMCLADSIGQFILDRSPESGDWQVELLTLRDCAKIGKLKHTPSDARHAEAIVIQALRPYLNTQMNCQTEPLPEKYERQEEIEKMRKAVRVLHVPYTRRGK